ncbi:gliding motility-associated C-terminal domain-containing protein [Hymenobacter humi]|uniref:Gliding motility-associated C-terminal domain-containing protein n=1 Tax=Hymenobacter humi TaxID=1411620 RepID=A0ABW2U6J5_9BACT
MRLADVCGNTSPESSPACPALLTATAADPDGTTATLSWTPFTGPDPSVPAGYVLQRVTATGSVLSTVSVSGSSYTDLTPPSDNQVLRYRLQISGAGLPAGTFSYSNLAVVARPVRLAIPTAFTPNGDGLNDVLEVKGKYLRNYTFVVVDRNGLEVFRGTQRSEAWDGTIRGHAPVPGAYVWRFQQVSEAGQPFSATGSVTILK